MDLIDRMKEIASRIPKQMELSRPDSLHDPNSLINNQGGLR